MTRPPHLTWWNKTEARAIDIVRVLAQDDPLVTSFGGGAPLVAMEIKPDGYLVSWTIGIAPYRTLPEVELFIAKVASYIIDEPIDDV